jgi:hypothetical protein
VLKAFKVPEDNRAQSARLVLLVSRGFRGFRAFRVFKVRLGLKVKLEP